MRFQISNVIQVTFYIAGAPIVQKCCIEVSSHS
jgi:hypothetical protein